MREPVRRCLSVLLVASIVTAGSFAYVNLDQGPEPVDQYGPVQEGEAIAPVVAAGLVAAGAGAYAAYDYITDDTPTQEELSNADDRETNVLLYQSATSEAENNDFVTDSFNNWAQDMSTIGTMEGKAAYIRSLESANSSLPAKTSVKTDAVEGVNNYYSGRLAQYLDRYTKQVLTQQTLYQSAVNETNTSFAQSLWTSTWDDGLDHGTYHNVTVTLYNGSAHEIAVYASNAGGQSYAQGPVPSSMVSDEPPDGYYQQSIGVVTRQPPDSEYSSVTYYDQSEWVPAYNEIENSRSTAITQVENFVDSTYSNYQLGEINESDLIDPYLAARDYSPDGNFGTFTHRSLSAMGYSPPTNLSETKEMNLSADGEQLTGILLSDGLPAGGEFEIGKEYLVSNLDGRQFVQTGSKLSEIEQNVTINSVQGFDGEQTNGTVPYQTTNYNHTSIEEYKATLDDYQKMLAEANARQEELQNQASDGPTWPNPFSGLSRMQSILAIVAIAGAALLLIRN